MSGISSNSGLYQKLMGMLADFSTI